ncbi:hypothetical protein LMG33810_001944 [Carnimonas sp. LMG 33810]
MTADELMSTSHRRKLLKVMWDLTSLTHDIFDRYIKAPIDRYAELVQALPASESHHHAYAGGLLDHTLESAVYALRLRQNHLLPPGAKPEAQSAEGELWSAAVIYAALLHDIGKALVDMDVILSDGSQWLPWNGPIQGDYQIRYRQGRDYHLHEVMGLGFAERILGNDVMQWLMEQPGLFSLLMYTASGHAERGGIIAQLSSQGDRASVAKSMGGNPVQALSAPVQSLQRKLADGLRYLVREQFILNQKGGIGWLTQDGLWLVSPKAVNELKTWLMEQGIKGIPSDLGRLYGEMQSYGIIQEVSEGKSVWKCAITDGAWQHTLNMVKVPAAMIWPDGNLPETFSGTVAPKGAAPDSTTTESESVAGKTISTAEADKKSNPVSDETGQGTLNDQGDTGAIEPSPIVAPNIDDDLLDMFPEMDTTTDVGTASTSSTTAIEQSLLVTEEPAPTAESVPNYADKKTTHSHKPREIAKTPATVGQQFWEWVSHGIVSHDLVINDTKAVIHVVDRTFFFVSPNIFKRFAKEVLNDRSLWEDVQKSFQRLGKHEKRADGVNIQTVIVSNPTGTQQSRLKGYRIKEPAEITRKMLPDNWLLTFA